MHPAYSVIFFTTASGAGYGMLCLLGLLAVFGLLPPDRLVGLVAVGAALALVTGGLLSSTAHLGRPERAWRAFSQWRTSWLSREGVAAVATFVPAGLFGLGWVVLGRLDGWVAAMGALAALGAVSTVVATAMIYASLKPIPAWHNALTLPSYLVFAAVTGMTLCNAVLQPFAGQPDALPLIAALATLAAWAWKRLVWTRQDAAASPVTANSATGLRGGTVRSVEWPHTEENYVMKEMGFRVARKHALRLRRIAQAGAFALPAALLLLAALAPGWTAVGLSIAAAVSQMAGMLVERWLFFAEARHVVGLYYGR